MINAPAPSLDISKALQQAVEHHRAQRLQDAQRLYQDILKVQPRQPDANHNLGVLAIQMNRPGTALPYLKTALEANPEQGQYWLSYIDALIRAGQLDNAGQILQQAHRRGLRGPSVDVLAEQITRQLATRLSSLKPPQGKKNTLSPPQSGIKRPERKNRPGKAKISGKKRIENKSPSQKSLEKITSAVNEYQSGNLIKAQKLLQEILSTEPNNIIALWHLSIVTQQSGNIDDAISIIKNCLLVDPNFSYGYNSLGLFYHEKGELKLSVDCFNKALCINPNFAESFNNLGMALYDQGILNDAKINYEKAIRLNPDFSESHNNLGVVLKDLGQSAAAEASYRQAISLKPDFAKGHLNLGNVLAETGRLAEAESCYRQAISLKPDYAEAYTNLGIVIIKTGRLDEAESCHRQAIALKPDCLEAHSNLLFSLNLNPARSAHEVLAEAKRYGKMVSARAQPYRDWAALNQQVPPLRVGLVSGDFKSHPVGYFLEKVLTHVDGTRIELLAYVTQPVEDDLTRRLMSSFRTWRSLVGLKDVEAARCIHDDGVHILVDLAGHTAKNRLPVFAWKPAPVQATWLGYFATTGMEEMDYLLADKAGVPVDHQVHFSEEIWYLPETRLCFTPPAIEIEVAPLPALKRGHITLGCFQELSKINDDVLAVWGRILSSLPGSVLRLQTSALDDAEVCSRLRERMGAHGIDPRQILLCGNMSRAAYLAAYAEVDLLLDTFPYPGGTTTCEALWMGVPTLTLAGNTLLARQGASLLTAAGLSEWVATNQDEYVAKAITLAGNLPGLTILREGLRKQVGKSPLFDAARFAENLEAALLEMWRRRSG